MRRYLEEIVFPRFMEHQVIKLSASGQELGGSMLFTHHRIGFSGTPSDLLPLDLGRCGYEVGSDGKMLHVLTDPIVMSVEFQPPGWSVSTLLDCIANAEPRYNALIDTGALITGLSNKEVARELLERGLSRWCEGVVFLDENDEKVILVKATGRVLKLSQCGIAVENRFAFYDQIHTTGMDINHALNARAALTLGKDMVFRDLAQGAFRMRGIAKGQSVTMLVIPEVEELMKRQLSKAKITRKERGPQAQLLSDVTAWLVINSMRTERVQFDQLCAQNLANLWRQNAWNTLLRGHEHFKVRPELTRGFARELLGDTFEKVTRSSAVSSKKALEGKVVGLYFEAHDKYIEEDEAGGGAPRHRRQMLLDGMKYVHKALGVVNKEGDFDAVRAPPFAPSAIHLPPACPHLTLRARSCAPRLQGDIEFVYVTAATDAATFQERFASMPWLALPFTADLKREQLRQLFDASEDTDKVVLIGVEGDTITRNGADLLVAAYTLQAAENRAKRGGSGNYMLKHMQDSLVKLKQRLDNERKQLEPHEQAIKAAAKALDQGFAMAGSDGPLSLRRAPSGDAKGGDAKGGASKGGASKPLVRKEITDFFVEPELPAPLKAKLQAAVGAYDEAKAALQAVPVDDFDELRKTTTPSEAVSLAVRTICVVFDIRPDFGMAQQRLMRLSPESLRRRLLHVEPAPDALPANATMQLHRYADADADVGGAEAPLAKALRGWLVALLGLVNANGEAAAAMDLSSCTKAMREICRCVCDLAGLDSVDDTGVLRSALLMVAEFPHAGGRSLQPIELELTKSESSADGAEGAEGEGGKEGGDGVSYTIVYEKERGGVPRVAQMIEEEKAPEARPALGGGRTLALPEVDSSISSDAVQHWTDVDTGGATVAALTCSWSDQGWGNQKGRLFARASGVSEWKPLTDTPAPHSLEVLTVVLEPGPKVAEGGKIELGFRVGGGGGHALHVRDAEVRLQGERMTAPAQAPPPKKTTAVRVLLPHGTAVLAVNGESTGAEVTRKQTAEQMLLAATGKVTLRLQLADGGQLAAADEGDDDDDDDDDAEFEQVSKLQQRIDRYESILYEHERTLEVGAKSAKTQEQTVEGEAQRVAGAFQGASKTLRTVVDGKADLAYPADVKAAHMVPTLVALFLMTKLDLLEKMEKEKANPFELAAAGWADMLQARAPICSRDLPLICPCSASTLPLLCLPLISIYWPLISPRSTPY